jgi:hypothetical protein
MNTQITSDDKPRGMIRVSALIVIVFATAFFPRLLSSFGAPVAINFVHFAIVPLACGMILAQAELKDRQQIARVKTLVTGLIVLFVVHIASAILNQAGAINACLNFLLLAEHFLLLVAIACSPISTRGLQQFKAWIVGFMLIHIFLALAQSMLLNIGAIPLRNELTLADNVQGVFYISNGGHVVSATISILFSLYYLISAKSVYLWMRVGVAFAAFLQMLLADAKQVIVVGAIAWGILIVIRIKDIKVTLQYAIAAGIFGYALLWCIQNVEFFSAFNAWARPELYGPQGDATLLKTLPFQLLPKFYESPLNWLLGLGPGHTIGRLGGWMIRDYWNLLGPLGATLHPVSEMVWDVWHGHYLGSSFFSPFWGWAGIWGDLGILGLLAYLYLWVIVWVQFCQDDFSKFVVLNVVLNGFIFTLMEEPGFMLTATILIGLHWQEKRLERRLRQQRKLSFTAFLTDIN